MGVGNNFSRLSPDEAASLIQNGQTIAFSGFTAAGAAKVVPEALARRALAEHEAGREFRVGVITGASAGTAVDGALAEANAISFRTPYQSEKRLREQINSGETRFFDLHLSSLQRVIRSGALGEIDFAVVEICDIDAQGRVIFTSSVGANPTFISRAKRIILELNTAQPTSYRGFHDIVELTDPPNRREIPIFHADDRIGTDYVQLDVSRIVGIVEHSHPDDLSPFREADPVTNRIGENIAKFLSDEHQRGRLPLDKLPIQSGVGNIANAVLGALGRHDEIPAFSMYTEVVQDAVIELIREGRISFASTCALTLSPDGAKDFQREMEYFRKSLVLRPQEITNSPEVVRRLGLISINTAVEIDLSGNANSTHVMGRDLLNGIGGSGDFTRNAFLSILVTPSTAKGGKISSVVPLVTHVDHNEHSLQVVVTEHGVADLRAKSPEERALLVIEKCADPSYRDDLRNYLKLCGKAHVPQKLSAVFAMHQHFLETGSMLGVQWE